MEFGRGGAEQQFIIFLPNIRTKFSKGYSEDIILEQNPQGGTDFFFLGGGGGGGVNCSLEARPYTPRFYLSM